MLTTSTGSSTKIDNTSLQVILIRAQLDGESINDQHKILVVVRQPTNVATTPVSIGNLRAPAESMGAAKLQ